MLSSFYTYKESRELLDAEHENLDEEERSKLTETIVLNYEENLMIRRELYHYENTNEILGEHPIFLEKQIERNISLLTANELLKKVNALKKSIWMDEKKLKLKLKEEESEKILERLKKKKIERKYVLKALNINE